MSFRPEGPLDARIMVISDAPDFDRKGVPRPFGQNPGELLGRMLAEAGIAVSSCFVTSAVRERPPGNKIELWAPPTKKGQTELAGSENGVECQGRIVHRYIKEGYEKLQEEIALVQPRLIIALGNTALWALTGLVSVSKWRGSTLTVPSLPGVTIVPTLHPASVLRQWSTRPIVVQDLRRAAQAATIPPVKPAWRFAIRPSLQQVRETMANLEATLDAATAPLVLSTDIETRAQHITCLGIAWSKLDAICIPFLSVDRPDGYWSQDDEAEIVYLLYRVLTHRNALVIGQNFIYDTQYILRHWGFVPRFGRDTMVAFHVCFPGMPKSLDHIASMTNEWYVYWKDDGKEWDKGADQDEDRYWTYNCEDCVRTYEADEVLQTVVDKMGLRGPHDFQQKLFYPVLRTMVRGVRIDKARQTAMRARLNHHAKECIQAIEQMVGWPLNPKSPKQMQKFFYEELGLPAQKKRGSIGPSCDDAALDTFRAKVPYLRPLVDAIKQFRSCETVAANALKAGAIGHDGRVHCSYNITGTTTFRFSSSTDAFGSGYNLQNITAGDE